MAKATHEIHNSLEGGRGRATHPPRRPASAWVLLQIALLDIVFSLDSVITAVGLVETCVDHGGWPSSLAVVVMLMAARPSGDFVDTHPTIKILALSFLILVQRDLDGRRIRRARAERPHLLTSTRFRDRRDAEHTHARSRATPIKLHSRYAEEPRR